MEKEQHQRYVPDHVFPMRLATIMESNDERIKFGKVEVVRVQVTGIIESIKLNESDMEFMLIDEQHRIMVQKVLTSTFPREHAQQFKSGNYVQVFGKVRMLESGENFLNAFTIMHACEAQYSAFQMICEISKEFYKENTPSLPSGTSTTVPAGLGLKDKIGSLDRFPMFMLEQSSSTENNMGVWPKEIENLAAGITLNDLNVVDGRRDEEDVFGGEESDDEEEEDSFDVGPVKVENMEEEDSFDAGPVTAVKVEAAEEVPMEEQGQKQGMEIDSFEDM